MKDQRCRTKRDSNRNDRRDHDTPTLVSRRTGARSTGLGSLVARIYQPIVAADGLTALSKVECRGSVSVTNGRAYGAALATRQVLRASGQTGVLHPGIGAPHSPAARLSWRSC